MEGNGGASLPPKSKPEDAWTLYEGTDLGGRGDVESLANWRDKYSSLTELKAYIKEKGYSGVSLRWGTAFFKKVDHVITRGELNDVHDCETWVYDPSKEKKPAAEYDGKLGIRSTRQIPLASDDEYIYALIPHYDEGNIKRITCETYLLVDSQLTKTSEVTLMKDDGETPYVGSKRNYRSNEGGFLSATSIASNGKLLMLNTPKKIHYFAIHNGKRLSTFEYSEQKRWFCPKLNVLFAADIHDSYSYQIKYVDTGFKAKVVVKDGERRLPPLPIILDEIKAQILDTVTKEVKVEKQQISIYQQLINDSAPVPSAQQPEEKKSESQEEVKKIEQSQPEEKNEEAAPASARARSSRKQHLNTAKLHDYTTAIILSHMQVGAQELIQEMKELGKKTITGDALMDYFKRPFTSILTKDMFKFLLRNIESMAQTLAAQSEIETHNHYSFLCILKVLQAHLCNLKICRIKLIEIMDRQEILSYADIITKHVSILKPNAGTENTKEVFLTTADKIQIHIADSAKKIKEEFDVIIQQLSAEDRIDALEEFLPKIDQSEENKQEVITHFRFLGQKATLQEAFQLPVEELKRLDDIFDQVCSIINQSMKARIERAISKKIFNAKYESVLAETSAVFVNKYCEELMAAYGDQLLEILENEEFAELKDDFSKAEKLCHQKFKAAQKRKKELEGFLYETFIAVSRHFNHQIQYLLDLVNRREMMGTWTWTDYRNLASFLKKLFEDENCVLRSVMKFSLMLINFNPDVTWLDEISEALKNTVTSINDYIVFSQNLPIAIKQSLEGKDVFLDFVNFTQRQLCYTVGIVTYRLIQMDSVEQDSGVAALSKLNILHGGLEDRFIPTLSDETKKQIEGSFKITSDEKLRNYSLQDESKVQLTEDDKLLQDLINGENKTNPNIGFALELLQYALTTKMPMVPHARLNPEYGMQISRAAFAVMLKFADKLGNMRDLLAKLGEILAVPPEDPAEDSRSKVKRIHKLLTDQKFEAYQSILKRWEQASQMRKWSNLVKQNLVERINKEQEEALRQEINNANPSAPPFTDELSEEQTEQLEARSKAVYEKELKTLYDEVIKKAKFLIQLKTPSNMRKSHAQDQEQDLKLRLSKQESEGQKLMKMQSVLDKDVNDPNVPASVPMIRKKTSIQDKRDQTGGKDTEYDWRDRFKQWRDIQMSSGAIVDLQQLNSELSQSVQLSVLGCLQADFTTETLKERVSYSLVVGLQRSAGLSLLDFVMSMNATRSLFFDLLQWFQSALRNNKSQASHYMDGIAGCGERAQMNIAKHFFRIIDRVVFMIRTETDETNLIHLIDALMWSYTRQDHEQLEKLNIFDALFHGNGKRNSVIRKAWGNARSEIQKDAESLQLPPRLMQCFNFLFLTILESLVVEESKDIKLGQSNAQTSMVIHQDIGSSVASQNLMSQIISILYGNIKRYLDIKRLLPHLTRSPLLDKRERFDPIDGENESPVITLYDDLIYYWQNGGEEEYVKKYQLEVKKKQMKLDLFIQRVLQYDRTGEDDDVLELMTVLEKIGKELSIEDQGMVVKEIINRDLKAVQFIKTLPTDRDIRLDRLFLVAKKKFLHQKNLWNR